MGPTMRVTHSPHVPIAEGDEQSDSGGYSEDGYGVGRVLTLSDGVFAIAMTLLVLSIPTPELGGQPNESQVQAAVWRLLPSLGAFALSFILVGVYWMAHHRMFRSVKRVGQQLLWLNLVALLAVCLMPFSTSFIIRYGNSVATTELYFGNLLLVGVLFAILSAVAYRSRRPDTPTRRALLLVAARSLLPVTVFALAMLLAPWSIFAAQMAWVLIVPGLVVLNRLSQADG
jgi:uncharacterized membrane protein